MFICDFSFLRGDFISVWGCNAHQTEPTVNSQRDVHSKRRCHICSLCRRIESRHLTKYMSSLRFVFLLLWSSRSVESSKNYVSRGLKCEVRARAIPCLMKRLTKICTGTLCSCSVSHTRERVYEGMILKCVG